MRNRGEWAEIGRNLGGSEVTILAITNDCQHTRSAVTRVYHDTAKSNAQTALWASRMPHILPWLSYDDPSRVLSLHGLVLIPFVLSKINMVAILKRVC